MRMKTSTSVALVLLGVVVLAAGCQSNSTSPKSAAHLTRISSASGLAASHGQSGAGGSGALGAGRSGPGGIASAGFSFGRVGRGAGRS